MFAFPMTETSGLRHGLFYHDWFGMASESLADGATIFHLAFSLQAE
jgi:hypothetical protein